VVALLLSSGTLFLLSPSPSGGPLALVEGLAASSTRTSRRNPAAVAAKQRRRLKEVSVVADSVAATRSSSPPPVLPVAEPRCYDEETIYKSQLHAWEEDDEEDFDDHISGFLELQQSTGSEILQQDLQQQIDANDPQQFLEEHGGSDASFMEKIAMSSVTEQLPQAALQALTTNQEKQKQKDRQSTGASKKKKYMKSANTSRVTPDEEIRLGEIIQKGVALHKVRTDAELRLGREITRQEWADAAGVSSTKELRRTASNYRQAKHQLVSANIGLVHAVVNQQRSFFSKTGVTHEEMVQEGSLGLLRAAELFDPSRGLRFSTYAVVWIKGVLSNTHVEELVKLPVREKAKWNKINKAQKDLTSLSGDQQDNASVKEVAKVAGMSVEDVVDVKQKMTQAQQVLSLDYEYTTHSRSGSDSSTFNTMQNDKAFQQDADLAERTQLKADVIAAMAKNLNSREARLMRLRYGLSDGKYRSFQECADAMGVSRARVQQINKQCLTKLREAAEAESLQEYLLTVA